MKRFTLVVLLLILSSVAAQAQAPAATPPAAAVPVNPGAKIAVINFRDALLDSDPGKAAVAQIEKAMAPTNAALEKLTKEMQELQTKLQNAKTEAEKSQINKDIEAKGREGQRTQEDGERMSQEFQNTHLQPVAKLINEMVDKYGKENNIAIILDPTTQGTNIVFAARASDITPEIMRMVNAEYVKNPKITAPSAAAPAPTAPAKP